ncbi:MAG: hypothetical protein GX061_08890 [Eubacteriaceae bacterium]|nr:hypothetical protein [Eubacteriaceae bacterium]
MAVPSSDDNNSRLLPESEALTESEYARIHNTALLDEMEQKNSFNSSYGLAPQEPVFTCGMEGCLCYLNSLRTPAGGKISWEKVKSIYCPSVAGIVDIYSIFAPEGGYYATVYINIYCKRNSKAVPSPFIKSDI